MSEEKNKSLNPLSFTMVSNSVIRTKQPLTDAEYRFYTTLESFAFQKKSAYPGRKKIAEIMQCSVSKVDRIKNNMIAKGAITKTRRGLGKTNLYFLNEGFFYKADASSTDSIETPSTERKQDEFNKTRSYNYQQKIKPYNEKQIQSGGETNLSIQTPTDVIFLNHLNRYKPEVLKIIQTTSDPISENYTEAVAGMIYYIRKFSYTFSINHPLYRKKQLIDCALGFLMLITNIEQAHMPVDITVRETIDRWFSTTSHLDENNLRMSVFCGSDSIVMDNCFEAICCDADVMERIMDAII